MYENAEDGLAILGGEGLIEKLEFDLILANSDGILDYIIEKAEESFIGEIEYAEELED